MLFSNIHLWIYRSFRIFSLSMGSFRRYSSLPGWNYKSSGSPSRRRNPRWDGKGDEEGQSAGYL